MRYKNTAEIFRYTILKNANSLMILQDQTQKSEGIIVLGKYEAYIYIYIYKC